jgi:hypothetical protein
MRVEHITGPVVWASYFVNGDASGLTAREQREADAWRLTTGGYVCGIVDDSERFTNALRLYAPEQEFRAGTVCDYIVDFSTAGF